MRAVQTPPRRKAKLPVFRGPAKQPAAQRTAAGSAAFAGCAAAFLAGYLPGILAGRSGQSELGQQLAAYYMDTARFSAWSQAFSSQLAAAFLQLLTVALCGFCVFGGAFLVLSFAVRGAFLGFCAANVLFCGGPRALLCHWLLDCLPNLAVLFVCLWLACYGVRLSNGLFQSVFLGGAPRGQLAGAVRRLLVRSGMALLLCGLFCALGAGLNVLVVGLLTG